MQGMIRTALRRVPKDQSSEETTARAPDGRSKDRKLLNYGCEISIARCTKPRAKWPDGDVAPDVLRSNHREQLLYLHPPARDGGALPHVCFGCALESGAMRHVIENRRLKLRTYQEGIWNG